MLLAQKVDNKITEEEYLEGELISKIKHEYVDGEVFAMAGASTNHNRLVLNLSREFGNSLKNTPCEPFASDMKVKVKENFYYPDGIETA